MAQLVCSSPTCRVVLMYPRGASQVQCSICGTVNCAMAVQFPSFVYHKHSTHYHAMVFGCRAMALGEPQ